MNNEQTYVVIDGLRSMADKLEDLITVVPEEPPVVDPEIPPAGGLFTDNAFSPSSFWYQKVDGDIPLHPNQANLKLEIPRQIKAFYQTVNLNDKQYCAPLFIASNDTPRVNVGQWNGGQKDWFHHIPLADQWKNVPIPEYATPSEGTDKEMAVYDPETDTYWEFWLMRKTESGGWEARWGGRIQNVKKSDGIFPGTYGTTATSLPFLGGQITAEELQRGDIRHAMGMALVEVEHHDKFVWPAHRSDGHNPNKAPNRIKEGQRFRLNPKLNLDDYKLTKVGRIIAKAAQEYGFVLWDKAGAVSLRAQNVTSYTALGKPNPYLALYGKLPDGKQRYGYQVLDNFPWNELEFLPENYGKPA